MDGVARIFHFRMERIIAGISNNWRRAVNPIDNERIRDYNNNNYNSPGLKTLEEKDDLDKLLEEQAILEDKGNIHPKNILKTDLEDYETLIKRIENILKDKPNLSPSQDKSKYVINIYNGYEKKPPPHHPLKPHKEFCIQRKEEYDKLKTIDADLHDYLNTIKPKTINKRPTKPHKHHHQHNHHEKKFTDKDLAETESLINEMKEILKAIVEKDANRMQGRKKATTPQEERQVEAVDSSSTTTTSYRNDVEEVDDNSVVIINPTSELEERLNENNNYEEERVKKEWKGSGRRLQDDKN